MQEEQSNGNEQRVKDREREKQERIRALIDHRPTVIAVGEKGSYADESSSRREVEEPFVTGNKATGKAEGRRLSLGTESK